MLKTIAERTDLSKKEKRYRSEMAEKILRLKEERNAIILVHNYQRDEIQDLADVSGDSLGLSQAAAGTDKDVIVFCGVHFMAESASIINPEKTVLLPVLEAGCPLADMATVRELRQKKTQYPDAVVVSYINTSAAIKAESDICCTSSNAIKVVNSLKENRIIFVPDQNLGRYVASHTDKEIILWEGFCATHHRLRAYEVIKAKEAHPDAEVVAHPECREEVLELANGICSTSGMFPYVKNSRARTFIICTEEGIIYSLKRQNPHKNFITPSETLICPNMKLITLPWLHNSLQNMVQEIKVPEPIRKKADVALQRMLEIV